MIFDIIFLKQVIIIALLLLFKNVKSDSDYKPYNTLAKSIMNTDDFGKVLINTQSHQNKKYDGVLFLVFIEEGLKVISYDSPITQLTSFQDQIQEIIIRDVFIYINSNGTSLKILKYEEKKPKPSISQVNEWQPTLYPFIDYFIVTEDENFVYMASGPYFIILDISKKLQIQLNKQDFISTNYINTPSLSYFTLWITKIDSFIFLSNQKGHINILQLDQDQKSFKFITQLSKLGYYSIQTVFIRKQSKVYSLSRYYGIYMFDIADLLKSQPDIDKFVKASNTTNPVIYNFQGTIQHIVLSKDEKFAYIVIRSVGLQIYDISIDAFKPVLVQRLFSDGVSFKMHFFRGSTENVLLSDGNRLRVYQIAEEETENKQNIYNVFNRDSCVAMKPFKEEKWPWFIVSSKDDKYIAVTGGMFGLNIYDISGSNIRSPVQVFKQPTEAGEMCYSLYYLDKRDLLVVGQKMKGSVIYDVKNFAKPVIKGSYTADIPINDHSDYESNNSQTLLGIASYSSIIILDITDIDKNGLILKTRHNIPSPKGKQRVIGSLTINNEFTYGFYSVREYGVFGFRIIRNQDQSIKSIEDFVSFLSNGSQYVSYDLSEKYVFVSDGLNGIAFINASDPDNPILYSKIYVNGWAVKTFQPPLYPNILFVNQMEKGQISMIDITDIDHPYKQSEMQFGIESSFSTASNWLSDKKRIYFAFTTEEGFRICTNNQVAKLLLSIYSKNNDKMSLSKPTPTKLLSQTQDSNELSNQNYESNFNEIYIQDEIHMNLTPLYYPLYFRLNDVNLYQNFQITKTPSWISYTNHEMFITIIPSYKDLQENQDVITLLLTVQSQLDSSYLESSLVTKEKAQEVITALKNKGLLDQENYFEQKIDGVYFALPALAKVFEKDINQKQILNQIIFNLRQLQFIYPLSLKIKPSLKINKILDENNKDFIETFSLNVQLDIQLKPKIKIENNSTSHLIQFVQAAYTDLLFTFSNNNTVMKIKGDKNQINQSIKSSFNYGIKSNSTITQDDIDVQFIIDDLVNKPESVNYTLSSCPFLKKIQSLELSNTTSIKDQYKSQYPNGLTVGEQFNIQFTTAILISKSSQQIFYTAFIETGSQEWQQIEKSSNYWLTFDSETLTLSGQKSLKDLFKSYKIKIYASDTFSNTEDSLTIQFSQISVIMTILLVFMTLIVILILLVFYFSRHTLHKFWNYYDLSYNEIVILAKSQYQKAIVIAPHTQFNLNLFVKEFLNVERQKYQNTKGNKKTPLKTLKSQIVQKYSNPETHEILIEKLSEDAKKIYHKSPSIFKNLSGNEISQIDSRINLALFSIIANWALQLDKDTFDAYIYLKDYAKNKIKTSDWYLYYLEVTSQPEFGGILQKSYSRTTGSTDQEYPPMYQVLDIEDDNMDRVLEILKENLRKKSKETAIKQKLLENAFKAQYYGFSEFSKIKNWKVNFGQTMHLRMNQVTQIIVKQKEEDKQKRKKISHFIPFVMYFREKLMMNFKRITLKHANKQNTNLPKWMQYEISDNNIIFTMRPQQKDIGEYLVELYNNNKYAFYIYKIIVRNSQKFYNQQNQQENSPRSTNNHILLSPTKQEEDISKAQLTQQNNPSVQESPKSGNLNQYQSFQKLNQKSTSNIQMQNLKSSATITKQPSFMSLQQ